MTFKITSRLANIIFWLAVWSKRRKWRHIFPTEFAVAFQASWSRAWPQLLWLELWWRYLFLVCYVSFSCIGRRRSILLNLRHIVFFCCVMDFTVRTAPVMFSNVLMKLRHRTHGWLPVRVNWWLEAAFLMQMGSTNILKFSHTGGNGRSFSFWVRIRKWGEMAHIRKIFPSCRERFYCPSFGGVSHVLCCIQFYMRLILPSLNFPVFWFCNFTLWSECTGNYEKK